MTFKSKLGRIALEELNEQITADETGSEEENKEAGAAEAGAGEGAAAGGEGGEAAPAEGGEAAAAAAPVEGGEAAAGKEGAAQAEGAEGGEAAAADAGAGAQDQQDAVAAAAATNEAEATGEPAEVVADAADADAEVIEEEMGAVDEIEEKTEDVGEDVEKLAAATESLEGCVAILDAAAQRGGLDVFGASLLRNNINTVTSSLKVKPLMLPALEDMETPSARIGGAETAKSSIVAFIKRIIDAVKNAFVRLGEWIVETYKRLTNAFVAVEHRAETLKARLEVSKMKEGKIDSRGLAAKLAVAGEVPNDVPAVLGQLAAIAKYLNDPKSYKGYLEALDLCEQMFKNPEKTEEIYGQISGKLASWTGDLSKKAEKTYKPNGSEDDTVFLWLFGNQGLTVKLPTSAEDLRNLSSSVVSIGSAKTPDAAPALNQADAAKICKQVAEIAKQARESAEANRGGVKELTAEIAKRKDTIVGLANAAAEAKAGDGAIDQAIRKATMFANTFLVSSPKLPVHAINRALPRNLSHALDYVAASISGPAEDKAAA